MNWKMKLITTQVRDSNKAAQCSFRFSSIFPHPLRIWAQQLPTLNCTGKRFFHTTLKLQEVHTLDFFSISPGNKWKVRNAWNRYLKI